MQLISNIKQIALRIGKFAISVGASTIIALVTIPLLIINLGIENWGDLALIQSLSIFFGIFVSFGWGVIGPSVVATTPNEQRRAVYGESVIVRGWLYILACFAQIAVLLTITDISPITIIIGTVASLLPYLGANWFYIGEVRPRHLLYYDTLPRIAGSLAGLLLVIFLSPSLNVYFLTILLFNLLLPVIAFKIIRPQNVLIPLQRQFSILRSQLHGLSVAALASFYVNVPIVIVQVLLPPALPYFALAERFFKYANVAFSPITQTLQGWIPEDKRNIYHRAKIGIGVSVVIGIIGFICLTLLISPASSILSHGQIVATHKIGGIFGAAFCAISISQIIGVAILIPLGKSNILARSTFLGALVGVPLMVLFAKNIGIISLVGLGGVGGVALAVAISEWIVTLYQALAFYRLYSRDFRLTENTS
jgi:O-antigen/teichoic acid export membrane protein